MTALARVQTNNNDLKNKWKKLKKK